MDKLTKTILFPVLILLIIGCQPSSISVPTNTPQPTPAITRVVQETVEPNPTPPVCTPLPDGMRLTVEPISSDSAQVQLIGLLPGEGLTLVFVAKPTATQSSELEIILPSAVESDGSFTYQERGLSILSDAKENIWTVKIIHGRGVACQEFTLP